MSVGRAKVVGLSGGVAAGKTTVARLLGEMGSAVVDADRLAHEALEEEPVREALRRRWGGEVFGRDGGVDRPALARIVFQDVEARSFLNGLVHPRVRARMREQIDGPLREGRAPLIVVDAALLVEAGLESWCDALVFVEAAPEVREERVRRGRGWEPGELARRESAQMPPEEKRKRSQFVIVNDKTLDDTRRQVEALYGRLVSG